MARAPGFQLVALDHGAGPPTMVCGYVGRLHLCLHTKEAPRPSEWTTYLRATIPDSQELDIGLVYTLGGGPSATQRQETVKHWKAAPRAIKFAVLTDTVLHQYVISALNLFQFTQIKAFPTRDMGNALAYLGASIGDADVRSFFLSMARLLGIENILAERWRKVPSLRDDDRAARSR